MRASRLSITYATLLTITFFLTSETATNAYVLNEKKWTVNGFTFTKKNFNWKGEDNASLEVLKHGKPLMRRQAHDVWVWTKNTNGEFVEAEEQNSLSLSDLNGDGVLDFVVRQWTGGAYCCYTYEVFSLTPDCKRLWHNDAGCAHLHVNGKTLAIEDGSFLYWRTHTLQGPRPIVYFAGNKNGFAFNKKLMLKPVNHGRLTELQKLPWSNDSEEFFIQLIYTGHAQEAVAMLEKLEPSERKEFAKSFMQAFRKSQFYYRIVELNSKRAISNLQKLAH